MFCIQQVLENEPSFAATSPANPVPAPSSNTLLCFTIVGFCTRKSPSATACNTSNEHHSRQFTVNMTVTSSAHQSLGNFSEWCCLRTTCRSFNDTNICPQNPHDKIVQHFSRCTTKRCMDLARTCGVQKLSPPPKRQPQHQYPSSSALWKF